MIELMGVIYCFHGAGYPKKKIGKCYFKLLNTIIKMKYNILYIFEIRSNLHRIYMKE